ncbi:MAG: hypothetical protein JJ895_15570 [Balneolaceae bacterium]|nr:hypothetical protein [Balneolaceae bacterium]
MKTITNSILTTIFALVLATGLMAQSTGLQYNRPAGKMGLNVFETPKTTDYTFDGTQIYVGGDFAIQFQGLSQTNSGDSLGELSNNFNLPTANLNIDVQLEDGLKLHIRTYMSSKNHVEAWVKGGHLQIDNLDFIDEGFMADLMQNLRIKVGMDDINYGDTHFRRSDNARAIYNPFVGNYLMDSFTTEPFMEFTYLNEGIIGVFGVTNGRLNQKPTPGDDGFVVYGKAGYDTQVNEDLRVRLTGSFYNSNDKGTRDYLYGGDRAGSRYYSILGGGNFDGRYNPRFAYQTAFQINPFVKFQGLEFFGVIESVSNGADTGGGFSQIGGELLYRFGEMENFYVGGRYNSISGEQADGAATREISRINIGGGWFMTNNVLAKIEYVSQSYDSGFDGSTLQGAEFNGFMIEAVIGF